MFNKNTRLYWWTFLLTIFVLLDILVGKVNIFTVEKNDLLQELFLLRLERTTLAVIVGLGLSCCGLLLQTVFQNPLAEPYILGVSSGASLGITFGLFIGTILGFTLQYWNWILFAFLGATIIVFVLFTALQKNKNRVTLLLVGVLLSGFTAAIQMLLVNFMEEEQVKMIYFFAFGSFEVSSPYLLAVLATITLILTFFIHKKNNELNFLLTGKQYAQSIGIEVNKLTKIIVILVCIWVAIQTSITGAIGFIGIAVPHFCRIYLQTENHKVLLKHIVILGPLVMVMVDLIVHLPFFNGVLPLNVITTLIGAPVVISLLINKKSYA